MSKMSKLRANNNRKRNTSKRSNFSATLYLTDDIVVTKHAIKRHKERNQSYKSDERAIEEIKREVQQSTILYISNNEEHRHYRGQIFVCKTERDEFGRKRTVVITELCTRPRMQEIGLAY